MFLISVTTGAKTRKVPDCERKKRRIAIWRRGGSIYVNLAGHVIRERYSAISCSIQDDNWLRANGGDLRGFTELRKDTSLLIGGSMSPPTSLYRYGVPPSIVDAYSSIGRINELYQWQTDCLNVALSGGWSSFIYSAPTSGGKSLVADVIMLNRLVYEGKRALVVCPFISICKERANWFRQIFFQSCGIVVEEYYGSIDKIWNPGVDIAVCTVQRAFGITNKLLETMGTCDYKFSDFLGTIIVDEFHLVLNDGAASASASMESLVSRLGLLPDRNEFMVIGMSATIPRKMEPEIMGWLNRQGGKCKYFKCDFRPIELEIFVKRGLEIRPPGQVSIPSHGLLENVRHIIPRFEKRIDSDNFASLCIESFENSFSTIVFCATRLWCENVAGMLVKAISPGFTESTSRFEVIEALRLLSPCGLHPILEKSIQIGVAFHHAGMTSEERSIIEVAFRKKIILILCATSTLSAGVNLPAERVILRTLSAATGGANPVTAPISHLAAKLKQMIGRAGRAGHANRGEAIICCANDKEEAIVRQVLNKEDIGDEQHASIAVKDPHVPVTDFLIKSVAKEILEIIIFFQKREENFFREKFLKSKLNCTHDIVNQSIEYLVRVKLVARLSGGLLIPTAVGEAVGYSSMPIDEAEQVYEELSHARSKLCLSGGDLHLLFLVIPPSINVSETEFDLNVEIFRIPEIRSIICDRDSIQRRKRALLALVLRDLISSNSSIGELTNRYSIQSGTIQYLQSNAAIYCSMVCSFCEKLQWVSLAAALGSIKPRLHFGVPFELVSLMEVEGISPNRARALVSGGFKTIEKIAHASPIDIAVALTRDVTVEGTQMTRSATAERILNVTSKLIIDNARIKLGLSEILPIATISEDISGLLSPISAPEFIQEILGTQWEENFGELSLSSFTDGEDELLLAIDQPNAVPKNQIQQSPFPTRSPYPMGTPLNAHDDDDRFLLEAFESIEARISTLPPRRRISEMTTIDVRPSKKIKRVSENVPKFILPTKTMMANDDQNFSLNS